LERHLPLCQGGQNERPVGNTLGTGHSDFRVHWFVKRDNFDEIR
jgi:hypothetical protein